MLRQEQSKFPIEVSDCGKGKRRFVRQQLKYIGEHEGEALLHWRS